MNATTKNMLIGVATSVVAMVIFKKFFDKPDTAPETKTGIFGW
ncbi:MAG: hypothetical protein Q9M16_10515 [Mariprofundus sp.]|nr:hypothetical protein [Mariprofundus sp.]